MKTNSKTKITAFFYHSCIVKRYSFILTISIYIYIYIYIYTDRPGLTRNRIYEKHQLRARGSDCSFAFH